MTNIDKIFQSPKKFEFDLYFFLIMFINMVEEKILKRVVGDFFPEITLKTFEKLDRNQYKNGEWVPDTPSLFVGVSFSGDTSIQKISENLTSLTGFEINLFIS